VGAVGGEDGSYSIFEEGGNAIDVLDGGIEGGVTTDDALEVSEFVEDGGEEVVFACGCACGGAEGGGGEVLSNSVLSSGVVSLAKPDALAA
jgi:hypothetical protein